MDRYRRRAIEPTLARMLQELPAVLLVGPRATGKTTTALRYARTVVRLDRRGEAAAIRADADAALRGLPEPVLLDEWQAVPEVLGAVKRAVDVDAHPGRFLLTGSVRADIQAETWPGTGRVVRLPVYGMTVAEVVGRAESVPLFDRLARREMLTAVADSPDLRGYVELALQGAFPEAALAVSQAMRTRWIDSYLEQLITRDAIQAAPLRDPARLRRYFEVYALNSAGTADERTLYEAAGINRKTAVAYEQLLINLMVAEQVPAWTSNRLKRLVLAPKRYLVDPALLAAALRVDVNGVLRDDELLGRLLDTFVTCQIRGTMAIAESRPRVYHVRDHQGRHEIDILGELSAREIVGVEVKATASPSRADAAHLAWLRDRLDDRFIAGVVLHTGRGVYELGARIVAVPISTLWV